MLIKRPYVANKQKSLRALNVNPHINTEYKSLNVILKKSSPAVSLCSRSAATIKLHLSHCVIHPKPSEHNQGSDRDRKNLSNNDKITSCGLVSSNLLIKQTTDHLNCIEGVTVLIINNKWNEKI